MNEDILLQNWRRLRCLFTSRFPSVRARGSGYRRHRSAPLKSLLHGSDLRDRLAKYQIPIQACNIEVTYRSGKWNKLCDSLFRFPLSTQHEELVNMTSLPKASPQLSTQWVRKVEDVSPLCSYRSLPSLKRKQLDAYQERLVVFSSIDKHFACTLAYSISSGTASAS